jgi:hypothetical protein
MNEVRMRQIRNILLRRLGRINLAVAAVLLTVGLTTAVYYASGGTMFSPGDLKAEPRAGVPRGDVRSHADLANNCAACHAPPFSGDTMANRCLVCHSNVGQQIDVGGPMHGRFAEAMECRTCHTEHKGPHASLTSMARFDHNYTAFKLTGAHRKTACQSCHTTPGYQGLSQSCVACHAEPPVHKGKFGTTCNECHTTNTWVSTPVNLQNLSFNHDRTGFKLTGKHATADCKSCHAEQTFTGKSQACASCHEPRVHKGRFGSNCTQCHTTDTWDGALFNHNTAFRLPHSGRNYACSACHTDQANYKSYTCTDCHEHRPERIVLRHRGKSLESIKNCTNAGCHPPDGRGRADASTGMADLAVHFEIRNSEIPVGCPVSDQQVVNGLASCPVNPTAAGQGLPRRASPDRSPNLQALLTLLSLARMPSTVPPTKLFDAVAIPVSRNAFDPMVVASHRRPFLNFGTFLANGRRNDFVMGRNGK